MWTGKGARGRENRINVCACVCVYFVLGRGGCGPISQMLAFSRTKLLQSSTHELFEIISTLDNLVLHVGFPAFLGFFQVFTCSNRLAPL